MAGNWRTRREEIGVVELWRDGVGALWVMRSSKAGFAMFWIAQAREADFVPWRVDRPRGEESFEEGRAKGELGVTKEIEFGCFGLFVRGEKGECIGRLSQGSQDGKGTERREHATRSIRNGGLTASAILRPGHNVRVSSSQKYCCCC